MIVTQVKSLCFSETKFRFQLKTNSSGSISIIPPCHEEGHFYSIEQGGISSSTKAIIIVFTSIFGILLILILLISDRFSQFTPNAARIIQAFVREGINERDKNGPKFFDFPRSGKKTDWKKLGDGNFGEVTLIDMSKKRSPYILSRVQRMGLLETDYVGKVAAKVCKLGDTSSEKARQYGKFLVEAATVAKFNHEKIVKLRGFMLDDDNVAIYICFELMSCELIDYVRNNQNLPEQVLLRFAKDITEACIYLSKINFVHRDIAARNCLVSENDQICKLADFGMAHQMEMHPETGKYIFESDNRGEALPMAWTAPEASLSKHPRIYNEKTDVWSFGVTLWEMFSRGACPLSTYMDRYGSKFMPDFFAVNAAYISQIAHHRAAGNFNQMRAVQRQRMFLISDFWTWLLNTESTNFLPQRNIARNLPNRPLPAITIESDEIYQIMVNCWSHDPSQRFSFKRIEQELSFQLYDHSSY